MWPVVKRKRELNVELNRCAVAFKTKVPNISFYIVSTILLYFPLFSYVK